MEMRRFFLLDKRLVIVRIECAKLLEGDIKGLEPYRKMIYYVSKLSLGDSFDSDN